MIGRRRGRRQERKAERKNEVQEKDCEYGEGEEERSMT